MNFSPMTPDEARNKRVGDCITLGRAPGVPADIYPMTVGKIYRIVDLFPKPYECVPSFIISDENGEPTAVWYDWCVSSAPNPSN